MNKDTQIIDNAISQEYEYGFTTDIENIKAPKKLNKNKFLIFIFFVILLNKYVIKNKGT